MDYLTTTIIPDQQVATTWNSRNKAGYVYTGLRTPVSVNIKDLSPTSFHGITVQCPRCAKSKHGYGGNTKSQFIEWSKDL